MPAIMFSKEEIETLLHLLDFEIEGLKENVDEPYTKDLEEIVGKLENACLSEPNSRLEYMKLLNPYSDTEKLKIDVARCIWNDERFLREDIRDIAKSLLHELTNG